MSRLTEIQLSRIRALMDEMPEGWSVESDFEPIRPGLDVYYYLRVKNEKGIILMYYCIDPIGQVELTEFGL